MFAVVEPLEVLPRLSVNPSLIILVKRLAIGHKYQRSKYLIQPLLIAEV
jgi:hypothetical protein